MNWLWEHFWKCCFCSASTSTLRIRPTRAQNWPENNCTSPGHQIDFHDSGPSSCWRCTSWQVQNSFWITRLSLWRGWNCHGRGHGSEYEQKLWRSILCIQGASGRSNLESCLKLTDFQGPSTWWGHTCFWKFWSRLGPYNYCSAMISGSPRTTPCHAALKSFFFGFQLFGLVGIHYLAQGLWSCRNSLWFWWCHSNSQNSGKVFEARYPSSSWWCHHPSKLPQCSRLESLKLLCPWFQCWQIFVNSRLLLEFGASEISSTEAFCKLQQYTSTEWLGRHPSAHRMGHRFQHRHIHHPNLGWHSYSQMALLKNWSPWKPSWSLSSSSSSTFQYRPSALAATL